VNTFLPALLELAINERSGEFCQSKILWLKPIDRTLFYCLHQVGLQAANLEGAGPYEHGAIEKNSGFQIGPPEVFDRSQRWLTSWWRRTGCRLHTNLGQLTKREIGIHPISPTPAHRERE